MDAEKPLITEVEDGEGAHNLGWDSTARVKGEPVVSSKFVLGSSRAIQGVQQLVQKVARLQATILIIGKTGTGKEVLARHIHRLSHLAKKPLVTLDLSTVPEGLVESALFGHEKGAFTGAHAQRPGKFEIADGGTLFLDEIACLRIDLQSRLLRAIQEGVIERIGGSIPLRVQTRLIVATHVDLGEAVKCGTFREDLYYRINVVPIRLPSLTSRPEDIPEFVRHFIRKYSSHFNKNVSRVTDKAMKTLMQYPWPGNIRELENVIARLVAISDDKEVLSNEDIPMEFFRQDLREGHQEDTEKNRLQLACDSFERNFILKALEKEKWNRKRTAEALGIPLSTLKFKFNRLQIYEVLSARSSVTKEELPRRGTTEPEQAKLLAERVTS